MKDDKIKKLISEISDLADSAQMRDKAREEGEQEVGDFVQNLMNLKTQIEPERDFILNILKEKSSSQSDKIMDQEMPSKVEIQLNLHRWFKLGIPLALVALAGVAIISNPFSGEQSQVAELKKIAQEEIAFDSAASNMQSFIQEEKRTAQIESALLEAQSSAQSPALAGDFFGESAINTESQQTTFDSDLAAFVGQEVSANSINSSFANF